MGTREGNILDRSKCEVRSIVQLFERHFQLLTY